MAQIKQIGVGQRTVGTVDGVNYVVINGRTIARRLPVMPKSMFETSDARKRQALFTMMQWHIKKHRRTINRTFDKSKFGSAANKYYTINYTALAQALDTLASQMVSGTAVTREQVEQAIASYATQNPQAILVALKTGYNEVYLTGAWPSAITLNATTGDSTIVVFVEENGDTTTFTPGTPGDAAADHNPGGNNNGSGSGNSNGSGSGSGTGSGTGSGDNGGNDGGGGDPGDYPEM